MAKSILTPFQKDVLELVSKNPIFTKNFYLTGGTALSEFYLRHRESEDPGSRQDRPTAPRPGRRGCRSRRAGA